MSWRICWGDGLDNFWGAPFHNSDLCRASLGQFQGRCTHFEWLQGRRFLMVPPLRRRPVAGDPGGPTPATKTRRRGPRGRVDLNGGPSRYSNPGVALNPRTGASLQRSTFRTLCAEQHSTSPGIEILPWSAAHAVQPATVADSGEGFDCGLAAGSTGIASRSTLPSANCMRKS